MLLSIAPDQLQATAGLTVTPEVYNGVYTTNAGGTYNTALTSQVGDGGFNANSDTTFTGLNVALDDSNPAAALPSSLTVTSVSLGCGTHAWQGLHMQLLGALIIGLALHV